MTVNAARKNRSVPRMTESDKKTICTFAAVGIYRYNKARKEMEVLIDVPPQSRETNR